MLITAKLLADDQMTKLFLCYVERSLTDCSEVLPSCCETVMGGTGDLAPHVLESISTHIAVCDIEIKFTLSGQLCWHGTALHCGKLLLRKTLFL